MLPATTDYSVVSPGRVSFLQVALEMLINRSLEYGSRYKNAVLSRSGAGMRLNTGTIVFGT